jgi:hypothetical protein
VLRPHHRSRLGHTEPIRMPVILPPANYDRWLGPVLSDSAATLPLLQRYSAGEMKAPGPLHAFGRDLPESIGFALHAVCLLGQRSWLGRLSLRSVHLARVVHSVVGDDGDHVFTPYPKRKINCPLDYFRFSARGRKHRHHRHHRHHKSTASLWGLRHRIRGGAATRCLASMTREVHRVGSSLGKGALDFAIGRLRMAATVVDRATITSKRPPMPSFRAVLARSGTPDDTRQRFKESLARHLETISPPDSDASKRTARVQSRTRGEVSQAPWRILPVHRRRSGQAPPALHTARGALPRRRPIRSWAKPPSSLRNGLNGLVQRTGFRHALGPTATGMATALGCSGE